jgi:hypothetical protein
MFAVIEFSVFPSSAQKHINKKLPHSLAYGSLLV